MGFDLLKKGKFGLHRNRISLAMNNSCFAFNTRLLQLTYCFIIVVMVIAMVCINTVKDLKYTHVLIFIKWPRAVLYSEWPFSESALNWG